MLDSDQLVPSNPVSYSWDGFAWNNVFPELPHITKLVYYTDFNPSNCAYIPASENLALPTIPGVIVYEGSNVGWMQLVPISVNYFARNAEVMPDQPTVSFSISLDEPETLFDFGCDVISRAVDVLAEYICESERKARESLKRFYRRNIRSSGVSKHGHLPFLVPRHEQVCVETAARDQVIHLEVIALADRYGLSIVAMQSGAHAPARFTDGPPPSS